MDNYGFAAASRIKNGTFRSLKDKRNIKHKFRIIRSGSVTGVHVNAEDVDEDEDYPDLVNSSDDESSKGGAREQYSSFRSPVNRLQALINFFGHFRADEFSTGSIQNTGRT